MKLIKNNWIIIVFIISIVAISSALIAEYLFKILPCKMCLYQRYQYYFIIFIIILLYLLKKTYFIWHIFLFEAAFIYGSFYALWHVGIEKKILPSLTSCSNTINNTDSLENLKTQILNQSVISCDEINWVMFGMSAATINSILLLFLLIINTIFIIKYYNKKKNEKI